MLMALVLSALSFAQNGRIVTDEWLSQNYTKREVMVKVRDGIHIYTVLYEPNQEYLAKLGRKTSPVMLQRTPYSLKPYGLAPGELGVKKAGSGFGGSLKGDMANYVADGYIIVYQNVRGRMLSEGKYEQMRPYVSGIDGAADTVYVKGVVQTDDATDVYDSIEWILANTANNGNVGVKGVSYPGFYATLAILSRHPAIKAVSPQAPATDWYMGDDAHHNGALCLTDSYRFGSGFYREMKKPATVAPSSLVRIDGNIYDYFKGKSISELSALFGDSLHFWSQMMVHPNYDTFWKDRDPSLHLKNITVPVMVTGGFYDAEDCYGAFRTYDMLKKMSPDCPLYLTAGPWYHGGWNNRSARKLSDAWFGEATGAYYQDNVEYPFFAYYLDGKDCGERLPRVNICPSGETMRGVMENRNVTDLWESYDVWPPVEMNFRKLYLSGENSLTFGQGGEAYSMSSEPMPYNRSITSDPASPVPYMDSDANSRDRAYMVADQRFSSARNDVATYTSPVLEKELHLAGPVNVHVSVSVTPEDNARLTDADVIVKLIDVRPDGYQMLVRADVMPLRFRKSFEKPLPLKSGKKVNADFTMCDIDHHFLPGHTLMVQVQASWFPLIAMNPHTYLKNQYEAEAADYKKAVMTIWSAESYLELPVISF